MPVSFSPGWHGQPKPLSHAASHPKPSLAKKHNSTLSTAAPQRLKPPRRWGRAFTGLHKGANPSTQAAQAHPAPCRVRGAGDARLSRRRRLPHAAQLQADKAVSHVIHNVDFMLAVTIYERAAEVLHLIRNQQCLCL